MLWFLLIVMKNDTRIREIWIANRRFRHQKIKLQEIQTIQNLIFQLEFQYSQSNCIFMDP